MSKGYITRNLVLEFIDYLQKKKNILVESQIVARRRMLDPLYLVDKYTEAADLANIVRQYADPLSAYEQLAHKWAKNNPNWRKVPKLGFVFREDVEEAREAIAAMENGEEICGPEAENLKAVVNALAEADLSYLGSRRTLIQLFPTEYMDFCHERTGHSEEEYEVQRLEDDEAPYWQEWLTGRYRAAMGKENLEKLADSESLVLFYDSRVNPVPESELVTIAKWICESAGQSRGSIRDYQKDETVVVRKKEYSL